MSNGCPSTTQQERWQARADKIVVRLALLEESYNAALTGDYDEYRLDTAGGSQRVRRRSLSSMASEIQRLEAELDQLLRRLSCSGVTAFKLRRRG